MNPNLVTIKLSGLVLLMCVLLPLNAWSQAPDTFFISLSQQSRSQQTPYSHSYKMLTKPRGDTIGFRGRMIRAQFPDLRQAPDTAFGNIYFVHEHDTLFPSTVFFLITDLYSPQARIWVDRNINYDFRDDGPPLQYHPADSVAVIRLTHPRDSLAQKWLRVMPISWKTNIKTDSSTWHRVNDFWGNHPNHKGFEQISVEHILASQRMTAICLDTVLAGDSLRLGLHDYDNNGRFDDQGEDWICVEKWGKPSVSTNFFDGASIWEPRALIKPNQQVYEVLSVDPHGRSLTLRSTEQPFPRITEGDPIPDFSFKTHEGDSTTLYALLAKKPYTLIDLWGSWCAPCRMAIPSLKVLENDFGDSLQILAVTHDNPEAALACLAEHEATWQGVWATKAFKDQVHNGAFPFYLLIGPDREIVMFEAWPARVRRHFAAAREE